MSSKFIFNDHSSLRGSHATFSASKSSWLRYTQEEMIESTLNSYRAALGTELHDFAASQIILGNKFTSGKNLISNVKTFVYRKYYNEEFMDISKNAKQMINHLIDLPAEVYDTVQLYINDGIGFRMKPEQPLVYSDLFFGTADTISFKNDILRIHDLKTGKGKVSMDQLLIYASLFCLEYRKKPADIDIQLRIYQNGEALCYKPEIDEIVPIMDKIVTDNGYLQKIVNEEE